MSLSKYWGVLEGPAVLVLGSGGQGMRILRIALFFLVYVGLDAVSYIEPISPFAITPWNPTVGLCVAITALYGPRALLPILVAPLLADAVNRGFPLTPLYSVWFGVLIAAETALIVFAARHLMPTSTRGIFESDEIRILITALPSALLIAGLHVGSLVALRLLPGGQFLESIGHLWVGDIIGVLIVAPFCFLLLKPGQGKSVGFSPMKVAETVLQVWEQV